MTSCFQWVCKISLLFVFSIAGAVENPLEPVKTDSPRDTMATFIQAMNQYRQGVVEKKKPLQKKIERAIRCLDLEATPFLLRGETGTEAAKLLKEVIDRVIVIDLTKVPAETEQKVWRLKGTEIKIGQVETGERKGEWLFTNETVQRAKEFYEKVKHLPYLQGSGQGAAYSEPLIEKVIPPWAQGKALGMYNWQWIGIFLVILLGYLFKAITQFILGGVIKISNKKKFHWNEKLLLSINPPIGLITATGVWYVGVRILRLEGFLKTLLVLGLQVVLSISVIRVVYLLSIAFSDYLGKRAKETQFPLDDELVPLIRKSLKVFIVSVGTLIMIQNLGVNVMSLLAGLGLGGLAFALAAKDTAANFFGSLMIIVDKPFKVGDWVVADNCEGTVEEIGFRSTRVRTFYNSLVSVPNSQLANINIDNMGRRQYRRVKTSLGLTYGTPPEKIESFISGIKEILMNNPSTRKDYFHVTFQNFGSHSLDILLYFFLETPSWSEELAERQNVFLEIVKLAKKIDVQFAFPTQSLHIESLPTPPPPN